MTRQKTQIRTLKNINGDEPIISADSSIVDIIKAYNWYSCNCETDDAVEYTIDYLKSKKVSKTTLQKISSINSFKLRNIGWNCRIILNGGSLPEDIHKSFLEKLNKLIETTELNDADVTKVDSANVISIQDRIREKCVDIIGTLETEIDKFILQGSNDFDVTAWFRNQAIKPAMSKKIAEYYQPLYSEIFDALSGKDSELSFAYRHWKKASLKRYVEFVRTIISVAETNASIAKIVRKPRKKKVKSASQIVSKLKFKDKDESLNINSIAPSTIVGASQLWVYNTKYRALSVYNALGITGFGVKGTTLTGYDEKTSITKRLRKPEIVLPKVLESGKITLRKIMDDIKCKPKEANGRINIDTVLLRVIK